MAQEKNVVASINYYPRGRHGKGAWHMCYIQKTIERGKRPLTTRWREEEEEALTSRRKELPNRQKKNALFNFDQLRVGFLLHEGSGQNLQLVTLAVLRRRRGNVFFNVAADHYSDIT